MKVTGIIAEYNPFHEGHAYQLNFAKSFSDAVIVVMSGSFVQRGDAAIFDKFKRTEVALKHGADLVLELPVVFSLNTAERFAFGAISVLYNTNIVDFLLFGSECGNIDILKKAAELLENEPPEVSQKLRFFLDSGYSYPKSREKAFDGIIDAALLSSPNNILGLEYIRQLIRLNSKIEPITQKRMGANYHDTNAGQKFPSAAAIRYEMLNNGFSYPLFANAAIHTLKKLDAAIIYNIRKNKEKAFFNIHDVSEGLENRLIKAAEKASTLDELVALCKTKRYPQTRLRRIILSSLLGLNASLSKKAPNYIRILGSTKTGFELLNKIKANSKLSIITKTADYKEENPMFEKDIFATDIFDLTSDAPLGSGQDFKTSPIIL